MTGVQTCALPIWPSSITPVAHYSVDDSPNIFTGTAPSDSNVMMNSSLFSHFMSGAGYPIGGASQIAQNIIPVIERAGGRVLVRARG